MENTINQIVTAVRTFYSQISSDKNIKSLANNNFSDTLSEETGEDVSVSVENKASNVIKGNTIKHSTNDENKVVVQVVRNESGKIVRTIPLDEQHALDTFE